MNNEILAIDGGIPTRPADNFLVYGKPKIEDTEINEVVACMRRGWIGTGPKVKQFETDFLTYKGVRHAVALNSCTAALHLSMFAAGIGPGDEVITTPMTFCATINSIIHCGATPVLADCLRDTMNIDPSEIEKKVTSRTKAILPVHFSGLCCNMDAIMELAHKYDLLVIEDCAHAIESEYHGKPAGTFGDIGCFSFYVTKNIVTGEGGMIVTEDDRFAGRIKVLGLHGMSKDAWSRFSDEGYKHYQVIHAGYKYNMMDMQAVIGIEQLRRVETYWQYRKEIWHTYNREFESLPCFLPIDAEPDSKHAYNLYPILLDIDQLGKERDWYIKALTAENIGVGVHYQPVHRHPYYHKIFGWLPGDFPNAEWIGERTLSLPLSAAMEQADIEDVISAFRKVVNS